MVLFLQETKCPSDIASQLMSQIWKDFLTIPIDAKGAFGSISISWNLLLVTLNEASSSLHCLSASFHILGSNIRGFLMNLYGLQAADFKMKILNFID